MLCDPYHTLRPSPLLLPPCVQVTTLYHLDRPMYMLGYLAAQNRVYLIDREVSSNRPTAYLSWWTDTKLTEH